MPQKPGQYPNPFCMPSLSAPYPASFVYHEEQRWLYSLLRHLVLRGSSRRTEIYHQCKNSCGSCCKASHKILCKANPYPRNIGIMIWYFYIFVITDDHILIWRYSRDLPHKEEISPDGSLTFRPMWRRLFFCTPMMKRRGSFFDSSLSIPFWGDMLFLISYGLFFIFVFLFHQESKLSFPQLSFLFWLPTDSGNFHEKNLHHAKLLIISFA